jgi:hypothetical protein
MFSPKLDLRLAGRRKKSRRNTDTGRIVTQNPVGANTYHEAIRWKALAGLCDRF